MSISFKDLGIVAGNKGFIGEKIKTDKILNRKIEVYDFKIEDSTVKPGTKCLHLQIAVDGTKRLLFTSGTNLIDAIKQVPKDKFPFETTIIKENERLYFT